MSCSAHSLNLERYQDCIDDEPGGGAILRPEFRELLGHPLTTSLAIESFTRRLKIDSSTRRFGKPNQNQIAREQSREPELGDEGLGERRLTRPNWT